MDKAPDAFRTISEVADHLETPAHVLRFWETRFPQVKPVKGAGGRRYYRPADVALLSGIRRLLHDDGMTIRGVQKILRDHGVRHVAELGGESLAAPEPITALLQPARRVAEVVALRPAEAEQKMPEQPETLEPEMPEPETREDVPPEDLAPFDLRTKAEAPPPDEFAPDLPKHGDLTASIRSALAVLEGQERPKRDAEPEVAPEVAPEDASVGLAEAVLGDAPEAPFWSEEEADALEDYAPDLPPPELLTAELVAAELVPADLIPADVMPPDEIAADDTPLDLILPDLIPADPTPPEPLLDAAPALSPPPFGFPLDLDVPRDGGGGFIAFGASAPKPEPLSAFEDEAAQIPLFEGETLATDFDLVETEEEAPFAAIDHDDEDQAPATAEVVAFPQAPASLPEPVEAPPVEKPSAEALPLEDFPEESVEEVIAALSGADSPPEIAPPAFAPATIAPLGGVSTRLRALTPAQRQALAPLADLQARLALLHRAMAEAPQGHG